MGRVTVKKVDEGVAWGSLHWQYLEDIAKITPHEARRLRSRRPSSSRRIRTAAPC